MTLSVKGQRRLIAIVIACLMGGTLLAAAPPASAYNQDGTVYFDTGSDFCGGASGGCTSGIGVTAWAVGSGIGTPVPISVLSRSSFANGNDFTISNATNGQVGGNWVLTATVRIHGTVAADNSYRISWVKT